METLFFWRNLLGLVQPPYRPNGPKTSVGLHAGTAHERLVDKVHTAHAALYCTAPRLVGPGRQRALVMTQLAWSDGTSRTRTSPFVFLVQAEIHCSLHRAESGGRRARGRSPTPTRRPHAPTAERTLSLLSVRCAP
jgi:hypothetical protein